MIYDLRGSLGLLDKRNVTNGEKTAVIRLAEFVAKGDIRPDAETLSVVRAAFIDVLGCILLGARLPTGIKTAAAVADWGTGPAPVLGTNLRLPAPWAAFANASLGHATEFDDWEIPGNTHPSVVMFPALLAVAAARPTTGQAIVEAYVAGFEVIARLGEATNFEHYNLGWHATATLGAVGATAAVARLQQLDREQTAHALSLSLTQGVGYTAQFGSNAKPLQAGFAAKAGVVSTSLAAQGLIGQLNIFEAAKGFNQLMAHGDRERFERPFSQNPGDPLALKEYGLLLKPYPTCAYTHRLIDCALKIRSQHKFVCSEIKQITASLPSFHAAILLFRPPQNVSEALFSVPCCIALALLRGRILPTDIETEAWSAAEVVDLMTKIGVLVRQPRDPALNYDEKDPDWLEVVMQDGRRYRSEVAFPLGAPQNRMSAEAMMEKFLANAGWEAPLTSEQNAMLSALREWDCVDDINEIVVSFGRGEGSTQAS